jgi:hypothetical protein
MANIKVMFSETTTVLPYTIDLNVALLMEYLYDFSSYIFHA